MSRISILKNGRKQQKKLHAAMHEMREVDRVQFLTQEHIIIQDDITPVCYFSRIFFF